MSTTPLKPGTRINGKYEIQEQIGAGAHGTVYRAIQHPVGRLVALKFISRHLSKEPENRARFFHEAQALARLSHPAVVTLIRLRRVRWATLYGYGIHRGRRADRRTH